MLSSTNDTACDWVAVVSGLPRSGTSLAMAMLAAGGLPVLVDCARAADADNPRGYYEYGPAKRLRHEADWLDSARGHAVKVISYLLDALPQDRAYRIVFMGRPLDEVLASQRIMLARQEKQLGDEVLVRHAFEKHLAYVSAWLAAQPNIAMCQLAYGDVVAAPQDAARRMNAFLGGHLDETAMAAVVEPALHRQRSAL